MTIGAAMALLTDDEFQVISLGVDAACRWKTDLKFDGAAAVRCPKIYMLVAPKGGSDIMYIGQTGSTMAARLRNGFSKAARYRYKWASGPGRYRLLIWNLERHISCGDKRLLESVEAELVLGARLACKGWPQHQTGIHFRHSFDAQGKQVAPRLAIRMLEQYYEEMIRTQHDPKCDFLENERKRVVAVLREAILIGT